MRLHGSSNIMSSMKTVLEAVHEDKRIQKIKQFLLELSTGNMDAKLEATNQQDDINGIIRGLKVFQEEMKEHFIAEAEAKEKLDQALLTLSEFSKQNFNAKLPVYGNQTIFDGLAAGINVLGKHLEEADLRTVVIHKIFNEISKDESIPDFLFGVFKIIKEVIDFDDFCVCTFNKAEHTVTHLIEIIDGQIIDNDKSPIPVIGNPFLEQIILQQKDIVFSKDQYDLAFGEAADEATRMAMYGLPLQSKNSVVGSIALKSYADFQLCEKDQKLLCLIGKQIATLIERKQGQLSLEKSEEKNRAMIQANPDVIFRLTGEGDYIDYHSNPGTLILPPESFNGTNIKDVLTSKQSEECLKLFRKALETGGVQIFHHDLHTAEEHYFFEGRIVKSGANEVLLIVREVTSEKKQQLALKASEKKYKNLFQKMNEGLLISSPDGTIITINPSLARLLGYREEELIGINGYKTLIPPEYNTQLRARLNERAKGISSQYETQLIKKSGEIIWVSISASPYHNSEGNYIGVMSIITDISSRKQAELIKSISYNIATKSSAKDVSVEGFCQYIREQVGQLMDVTEFYIATATPTNMLNFLYISDSRSTNLANINRKMSNGLSELVINKGEGYLLRGKELEEFLEENGIHLHGKKSKCWVGAPLISGGTSFGIIACQSYTDENTYNESHLELLSILGHQIGLWVERKKAEEDQASLLKIFENSANEMYIFDSSSLQFRHANKAALENLGYTLNELLQLNFPLLELNDDFEAGSFEEIVAPLKSGEISTLRFETNCKRKDRSRYPVEVHLQHVVFKGLDSYFANVINISERKEHEKEIRQYARHFSVSKELMCIANLDGYFEKINLVFESKLGYENEEILNRPFLDFVHPDDVVATKNELLKLADNLPTHNFVIRFKCKDQSYKWLSWSFSPDSVGSIYGAARDITDLKIAEQSLKESENLFKSIFQLAEYGIALLSDDGKYKQVNPKYAEILGYKAEELLGQSFPELTDNASIAPGKEELKRFRSGEKATLHFEKKYIHKKGHPVCTNIGLSHTILNGERYIIAIVNDISHLKKTERALRKSEEEFRSLAENAPNFIVRINEEHIIEYANLVSWGSTLRFVLGQSIYHFINEGEHHISKAKIDEVFTTGKATSYTFSTPTADDRKEVHFQTNLGPIKDDTGKVNAVILIFQDITEQVVAINETKRSLNELRLIDKINRASLDNYSFDELATLTMDTYHCISTTIGGRFYLFNTEQNKLEIVEERLNGDTRRTLEDRIGINVSNFIPKLEQGGTFNTALETGEIFVARGKEEVKKVIAEYTDLRFLKKLAPLAQQIINLQTYIIIPLSTGDNKFGLVTLAFNYSVSKEEVDRLRRFTNGVTATLTKTHIETELAGQRQFMDDVLNNIPADIAVFNAEHQYIFLNRKAVRDEETRKWLIGKTDFDYCEHKGIVDTIAKKRRNLFQSSLKKGTQTTWIDDIYTDTSEEHILRKFKPVFNGKELQYMIGYGVDITDRVIAENQNKNLASIVAHSDDAIVSIKLDGNVLSWNQGAYKLFGYTAEEIIGEPINIVTPKDKLKESKQLIRKVLKNNTSESLETVRLHKSGRQINVSLSIFPLLNDEGKIHGISGIIRDITDRYRAEFALKESEALLKNAQKIAHIGSWQWDVLTNNITWSDELYRIYGLDKAIDEITFELFVGCIYPDDRDRVVRLINESMEKKEPYLFVHRLNPEQKNGKICYVECRGTLEIENDQVIKINGTAMDVTTREEAAKVKVEFTQQLEEQVRERTEALMTSQKKLEKALEKEKELGELKSRFVSTASHQFRTPMAIIQSNAELLRMITSKKDTKSIQHLDRATCRIQKEVKRMTNLMDEVLLLGKITSGGMSVQLQATDMLALCHELGEQFNAIQQDQRVVEIETTGKPRMIQIDPQLMNHAIGNLLSNAFKYSDKKNPQLQLSHGKDQLKIAVADHGIGIPQEEIDNLFQPFHRAENVKEIEGTGLGLAIVKEYVELNDGTVEVQSELNKGSVFTITLPYPKKEKK